ncbi:predicted protein [Nematostella vectensis]|uniref:Amino acid transporter transmembrane domain-containing protein n=1 Tax=Nematostella vectensis TaxID=45351 RepID=A7SP81_NEMVE|nr:predicted protein [Nematostella vectensis]|eukprot:XP_001626595.1 predicted protein [Nematostella vectensis]
MTNLYGNPEDIHKSATYHRYKYISKLSGHSTDMIIPDHMLPVELFLVIPGKPEAKQSSLVTIFAIWNTMMGTSLLSMPWALSQAGFGCGIGLMVGIAGLCLYTCYLVLKSSYPFGELFKSGFIKFADICRKYFGRTGELVATIFSIAAIAGAAVVFWVLMSNFLFNSGKFIHESIYDAFPKNMSKLEGTVIHTSLICPVPSANNTSPNTMPNSDTTGFYRYWQGQKTIPFFLIALMFPLCSVKSPTFFTKFNSLGTLAVIYIIIFVSIKASIWGINMDFAKIPEFQLTFPALTGTLTLAFFIHNCILSILSHQKTPEYNARDLSIAYGLVAFTYTFVGALFYAAFPLEKSCIHQVFLDNMPANDIMTFGARIGLFFQLVTVFPLVIYIVRVQFMLFFFGSPYPSTWQVFLLNAVLIGACVLFARFYPHVGNIIRYSGSISGLVYIFTLPCLVHMYALHKKNQLSWPSAIFHSTIVLLGVLNLVSQFLISV